METIGFIGLGLMGESMCENIINKSGQKVFVYDVKKAQVEKLEKLGAEALASISSIAQKSSVIFIMVPTGEHVTSVVNELITEIQPGSLIVDMSTIEPEISKTLADKVKAKGASMLDAPVVKSKPAAISGQLGIYVGGSYEDYERVKDILAYIGSNIIYMGENGNGLAMKICHNMLVAQIQNGVNEMLILAQNSGLELEKAIEAISYGGGQSFYLDSKKETLLAEDYSTKFSIQNMNKDINIAEKMAHRLGLRLPGLQVAKSIYKRSIEDKIEKEDFSATYKIARKLSKS